MLSPHHVAAAYRETHEARRMAGDRPSGASAVQELVTTWKLPWVWKRRRPVGRGFLMPEIFETAPNLYTFVASIGNGGAGDVYRVRDVDGQEFALKLLRSSDSGKRKRFRNELVFCQQPQHSNIIRVIDSGVKLGPQAHLPFYVMEMFPDTLRKLMVRKLPHSDVLLLFDHILSGVEAAHLKGVYHRDLKPENILSSANRLVVADFGIAHFEEEELFTAVETDNQDRLANFVYAAPEQRVRTAEIDRRADIFALGLMLNEMFTGHVPSGNDYPMIGSVAPRYKYLDDLVKVMTKYLPADRPQSILAVKESLLARGSEFVAFQRLEAVRNEVVPASQPDDPLQGQDVKLTGLVDYDPNTNQLLVGLHPEPPRGWWTAMKGISVNYFIGSASPQNVGWSNGKAILLVPSLQAPQVLSLFKDWVSNTNQRYRTMLADAARRDMEGKRQDLQRRQKAEEERVRVLAELQKIPLS